MKAIKKLTALTLVIVIILSLLPLQAMAAEDGDSAQLRRQLQEAADEAAYPNGLFELLTTRMNTSEDMSSVEIAVVRKGGTSGAASVTLKAIDVTAEYGEDYTLSVKDGLFTETLPENEEAKPLIDSLVNGGGSIAVEDVGQDGTGLETGNAAEETDDTFTEAGDTGLRAMRDASVGNTSTRPNWREVDDAQKDSALSQEKELYDGLPGVCCTLDFADGEYIKTVRFNTIDDNVSEDEEQVLFALADPVGGVLGDSLNGFMNIEDNEKAEPLLFEMADSEITADPGTGYAEVTVKRTSGLYRYGSVCIGTAAVTAQPGVDYDPTVTKLSFVPGQETQKVQISLLSGSEGAGLQFYIRLDPNGTGAADAETGRTLVTIASPVPAADLTVLCDSDTAGLSGSVGQLSSIGYESNYRVRELTVSDIISGNYSIIDNTAYLALDGLNSSKSIQFDADLTMVDKLSWYWSNPCDGYYKGWGWTYPVNYQDFSSTVTVCGGIVKQYGGKFSDRWDSYTLPADFRQPTSIRFATATYSSTKQSQMFVSSVKLYYTPITVRLESDKNDPDAVIIPRTYTASEYYTEGASVYAGGLSFGGDTTGAAEKVFYDGDTVCFEPQYADTRLTDTSEVYLWGYKIERIGSNDYYYVTGNSLNIRALYTGQMEDADGNKIERGQFLMDGNTVVIRPVYKARTAFVQISFDETKGGMAQNSFENGEIVKVGMLDTIAYDAYGDTGNSVYGYEGEHVDYAGGGVNSDSDERDISAWTSETYTSKLSKVLSDSANLYIGPVSLTGANAAVPNELNFSPEKTFTELTVLYSQPFMTVKIDPKSAEADEDKGSVFYVDTENYTEEEGNSQKSMIITGIQRNTTYTLSGVPDDGYRILWKDWTGDTNGDGLIDGKENAQLGDYADLFNRNAVYGDFFSYLVKSDNPLIYYRFVPKEVNTEPGTVLGQVILLRGNVLDNTGAAASQPVKEVLPGATVTINGHQLVTDDNGEFSLTDSDFASFEHHSLIVGYKGVSYKGYLDVNSYTPINIKEYDDFIPYNFTGYETVTAKDGNGNPVKTTQKLDMDAVGNKDTNYTFQFDIKAVEAGESAQKAYVRIYSKEGNQRGETIEVTPEKGRFIFTLNPATAGVIPGDTMTLQIEDQHGVSHLEHNVGFSFVQSLDTISLMTSFKSPVSGAIDMVGSLDTAFNLGLSGKLDDYESSQGQDLIITFGFDKSWEKEIEGSGGKEDKALKDAAGGDDTEAAKDTVKNAVSKGGDNKTSASLTNSMQFGLSTAIYLKLSLDTDPTSENYNFYYFNEMIVSATVSGSVSSKVEIQTPVGVSVFVQLVMGGDITALMAIEKFKKNIYLDENGSVDFSSASDSDPDRDFTIYGKFIVQPYIDITAGASFSVVTLSVRGKAAFDMNFTTLGTGHGSVTLTSDLALQVACFEFKWHIGNKTWDLFNYGGASLNADSIFSGEEFLYDSVSGGEMVSRDYLENRGTWQGDESSGLLTALLTSNHSGNEQTLLTGVYPYPYTRLADLGDDRQLLVFLDDDTSQDDRNRTQLYYSLNTDGTWSEPQKLDTDSTPDSLPCVYDLGDSILVAWSSAYTTVSENDDVLDALNKNNIKCSFFSKGTMSFGEVQEVTQQTDEDVYSDVNPYIAYWQEDLSDQNPGKEHLMIVYTKSQYASTDTGDDGENENAVVGDVVNPFYTALAYRFYDFDADCWSDSGGESNYYGQSFIDASHYADVDESSLTNTDGDPSGIGYWSRTPDDNEVSVKTFDNNDPLIVDSDAIGYDGYAVLAYAVDMDCDYGTTDDRELFIQLYDFENNAFSPSIRIPEEQTGLSNLAFDQVSDNVYLYYLSDGDIHSIDIGYLVNQDLLYYENEGAFVVNKMRDVYQPSQVVVQHKYDLVTDVDGNIVRQNEMPIDEFTVKSDDSNMYIVWCENDITYRDGVDPNSAEAADPENYYREHQIYAVHQTIGALTEIQLCGEDGSPAFYPATDKNGSTIDYTQFRDVNGSIGTAHAGDPVVRSYRPTEWSDQVRLTDEQGANYNDLDFVILSDGGLRGVYVKGMSQVTDVSGEQMPAEDVNSRVLMTSDFDTAAQKADVSIKAPESPQPGEILPVVLDLDNQSFSSLDNLTVSLVQVKDNISETVDEQSAVTLKGGETARLVLSWQAPDDLSNTGLQAIVSDGDAVVCGAQVQIAAASSVDISDVSTEFVGRDRLEIQGAATNNGNLASDDAVITAEAGGVQIGALDLGRMEVGETRTFEFCVDTGAVSFVSTAGEDGAVKETAELSLHADGAGEKLDILRSASSGDMAFINNIGSFGLTDGGGAALADNVTLSKGSSMQVLPHIEYETENQQTPQVIYVSSDESVACFGDGQTTLCAEKTGTAVVTAYLLPPNSDLTLSKNGFVWADSLSTLPNAAILTREFTVTVTDGDRTPTNTGEKTNNKTDEVTAQITGIADGHVTASVGEKQIEAALADHENSELIINVTLPDGTKTIDTDIPVSALRLAAENGASALTLNTSLCTVSFDENALSTFCGESAGDSVRISVSEIDPLTLSETARAHVGERPVYSFTVTSGGNTIAELNGCATVSIPYTPGIDEDTDAIIIYRINANGEPEIVPDCIYDPETGTIVFRTDHFSEYAVGYNKVSFSDIRQDAWYADAVGFIAARGITAGTGDGCFSPDASLTRGQFIVMLLRACGISPAVNPTDNFTDAGNTYYTDYLASAKQLGIASGIGSNLFAPDREITRQEMCTLLYQALKLLDRLPVERSIKTPADFTDAEDIASWAGDAVTAFVKAEVLNGSEGKLLPTGILSRAQMAQIFYNLMKN